MGLDSPGLHACNMLNIYCTSLCRRTAHSDGRLWGRRQTGAGILEPQGDADPPVLLGSLLH